MEGAAPAKGKNKIIIVALSISGALILAAGAYYAYNKFFKKGGDTGGDTGNNDPETSADAAAKEAALASISQPTVTTPDAPRTIPSAPSAYKDGQRVYAKNQVGLYKTPLISAANMTDSVLKDNPIGVFRRINPAAPSFAYVQVVLKNKTTGKYEPQYRYVPLAQIRKADTSKGEKN